jgi:hypothetical protein
MADIIPGAGVTFQDGVYSYRFGKTWDGTAPTIGANIVYTKCVTKVVDVEDNVEFVRVSTCNVVKRRFHSPTRIVTLDVYVPRTGVLFELLKEVEMTWLSYTATSVVTAITGVITNVKTIGEGPDGVTHQQVTIDFNADWGT